ncbi:MAG: DMT family transporter [Pseudomonadota bacterium]
MAVGMMLLPVGDAISKYLTQVTLYTGIFLAWSRFMVGAVLAAPYAAATGAFRGLGRDFVFRQTVRGGLIASTVACILQAVTHAPLADVYGAFFIGPSLATILAVVVLKERVRWPEWTAVLLGFIGVLMIVQPGERVGVGLLWAVAAGCCYGMYMVATRWAATSGPPMAQLAGQLIVASICLAPLGARELFAYGIVEGQWILLAALTSAAANLLQIIAFRHAGAAYLAPIVYMQIVSATTLSWVVFGDQLDLWAKIGICVILSSALFKVPWRQIGARRG